MGSFADIAARILETAELALESGECSELILLIDRDGQIRMFPESGWSFESLAAEHRAATIYRVRRTGNAIRLEGRAGSRTCQFETIMSKAAFRPPGETWERTFAVPAALADSLPRPVWEINRSDTPEENEPPVQVEWG